MIEQVNAAHVKKGARRRVDLQFRQMQQRLTDAGIAFATTSEVLNHLGRVE